MTARTTEPTHTTRRTSPGWWFAADRTWHRGAPPDGWRQTDDGRWLPPPTFSATAPTPPLGTPRVPAAPEAVPPLHLRQPTVTAALARRRAGQAGGPAGRRAGRGGAGSGRQETGRARRSATGVLAGHLASPWARVAAVAAAGAIVLTVVAVVHQAGGDRTSSGGREEAAAVPTSVPGAADVGGRGSSPAVGPAAGAASPADEELTSTTSTSSSAGPTATTATTGPPPTAPAPMSPSTTVVAGSDADGDALARCSPGQRATIERRSRPWPWYVDRYDGDGDGVFCE